MHVRLREGLFEPHGDTVVDDGARRRRRRRARPRGDEARAPEAQPDEAPQTPLGVRGDPGATLASSPLARVRLREAIVRRNHRIDSAERAPRRPSSVKPLTLVRIDWARARDTGLKIERVAADTIAVSGQATGCVPISPRAGGRSDSSGPRTPALSIGLDGVLFTSAVRAGDDARTCVMRWCERLAARFELEVAEVDGAVQVRFVRSRRPS